MLSCAIVRHRDRVAVLAMHWRRGEGIHDGDNFSLQLPKLREHAHLLSRTCLQSILCRLHCIRSRNNGSGGRWGHFAGSSYSARNTCCLVPSMWPCCHLRSITYRYRVMYTTSDSVAHARRGHTHHTHHWSGDRSLSEPLKKTTPVKLDSFWMRPGGKR